MKERHFWGGYSPFGDGQLSAVVKMGVRLLFKGALPLALFVQMLGCPGKWGYLTPLDPYTRRPLPQGQRAELEVSGLKIIADKFYFTPQMACLGLIIDNSRGYAEVYIDPQRTRLVAGELGTWALSSTAAAREELFRKIALDYYGIRDSSSVGLWSSLYLNRSVIPVGKKKRGLICFQLIRYPGDPEPIVITERCRVRLEDVRMGGGKLQMNWLWFERKKSP